MIRMGPTIKRLTLTAMLAALCCPLAVAQDKAPAKFQAALFVKILAMCTNLGNEPFTVHVVGAPDVAKELKALIGNAVGKASLAGVTEGSGPPSKAVKVVYVGDNVAQMIAWTQENKALSITGVPAYVNEGVTLGVGLEDRKAKILLNLSSTKAEGINWNPRILKVAATID